MLTNNTRKPTHCVDLRFTNGNLRFDLHGGRAPMRGWGSGEAFSKKEGIVEKSPLIRNHQLVIYEKRGNQNINCYPNL